MAIVDDEIRTPRGTTSVKDDRGSGFWPIESYAEEQETARICFRLLRNIMERHGVVGPLSQALHDVERDLIQIFEREA